MMPLDEGRLSKTCFPLKVGISTLLAPVTGEFVCYANQAFGWYWDNVGYANISIIKTN